MDKYDPPIETFSAGDPTATDLRQIRVKVKFVLRNCMVTAQEIVSKVPILKLGREAGPNSTKF